MVSNITLTDSGSNVVTIGVIRVEEMWVNELEIVKVAKKSSDNSIETKVINLLRSIRSFNIDGYIQKNGEEATGNFGGSDTLEEQRVKLRNMVNKINNVTMEYGATVTGVSGAIQKLSMLEVPEDVDTDTEHYKVKILLVTGTNQLTGEGA